MKSKEAKKIVLDLLSSAGFTVSDVEIEEKGEQEYYLNLIAETDASDLIGRNGEVLSAFQSIIKNIFRNQGITADGDHIKVDIDSYRQKQEENVLKMTDKRAQQVLDSGGSTVLPPMSPFFRRLVHLYVKENYPQLTTLSEGGGNDRAVCIRSADGGSSEAVDFYSDIDF